MSELISGRVAEYLEHLVPERAPELAAMEAFAKETNFPIIGPAAGQFCYVIARLMGATRVFEMGSGYGYSTAWFARAVVENGGGTVHHVVWDADLSARAQDHLGRLGVLDVVRFEVGEAIGALRATSGDFDLIFCDIDKQGYPDALPVIEEKLRPGGALIVDNLLWSGRIFDPSDETPATRGIREFTERIRSDPNWAATLVPIRDGLLLAHRAQAGQAPDGDGKTL
jgi:caffeoyl-CoA O-methyltransferase